MSLEEFWADIESSESWWNSAEASKEISEKYKESSKKAKAWIKRTKNDEKKAKKYDFLLANLLVSIIVDKKYDTILERLFKTMDYWYTSNFIIWIMSIINTQASDKIRELTNKEKINFEYKSLEQIDFNDSNLPKQVKNRINYWIEDIIDSLIIEYSHLQTKRIIDLLKNDDKIIKQYIALVFIFFLKEININISKNEAINISDFIIQEVINSLKNIEVNEV